MASQQRIEKLKKFLEADSRDSFARYALAMEYAAREDHDLAIGTLQELLTADPHYVAAYHQLGILFAKLNRTPEAKEVYEKGIDVAERLQESHELSEMREELEELEDEW